MEEKIALVFSWDPRRRVWLRERGPADAAPPPAEPIDDEAVQTYFLDPANGRWEPTILGSLARQVAFEMKDAYRSPLMPGLALREVPQARPRFVVEQETTHGGRGRLVAGAAVLLVLAAGGAFVAQPFISAPADADGTLHPSVPSPTAAAASSAPIGVTGASGNASAPATATATAAAATSAPSVATARPATPAPTVAPTTITLTVKTADGSMIFYRGPNILTQGTVVAVDFSVILPQGQRGNQTLVVYLGPVGAMPPMSGTGDNEGRYTISLKASVPKGTQPLAVAYGNDPTIYPLGTLTVR